MLDRGASLALFKNMGRSLMVYSRLSDSGQYLVLGPAMVLGLLSVQTVGDHRSVCAGLDQYLPSMCWCGDLSAE